MPDHQIDRPIQPDDVQAEAAFYNQLFDPNENSATHVMMRDALSRSTDANHLQQLIRLGSAGFQHPSDNGGMSSSVFQFAQADLPSLMQRSVGTERATEANKQLASMRQSGQSSTGTIGNTNNPSATTPPLGATRNSPLPKASSNAASIFSFMQSAGQRLPANSNNNNAMGGFTRLNGGTQGLKEMNGHKGSMGTFKNGGFGGTSLGSNSTSTSGMMGPPVNTGRLNTSGSSTQVPSVPGNVAIGMGRMGPPGMASGGSMGAPANVMGASSTGNSMNGVNSPATRPAIPGPLNGMSNMRSGGSMNGMSSGGSMNMMHPPVKGALPGMKSSMAPRMGSGGGLRTSTGSSMLKGKALKKSLPGSLGGMNGISKMKKKPSLVGEDSDFVRDFMKHAKDPPKKKEEKAFIANFMMSAKDDKGKDPPKEEPKPPQNVAAAPAAASVEPAVRDMEDKELFRQFFMSSIGVRNQTGGDNQPLTKQDSIAEVDFLQFVKNFDKGSNDPNASNQLLNFMRSIGQSTIGQQQRSLGQRLFSIGQSQNDKNGATGAGFMENMLRSTDFSGNDPLKALESLKSVGLPFDPQVSTFVKQQQQQQQQPQQQQQESLPRGASTELDTRLLSVFLQSQSGDVMDFISKQFSTGKMMAPMARLPARASTLQQQPPQQQQQQQPQPQGQQLAWNQMSTGAFPQPQPAPTMDNSTAEAAVALASIQPREEAALAKQRLQQPGAPPVAPNVVDTPAPKPKRKRQRKVHEPAEKVYVEIQEGDVLFGRGGRTNHHPGNKKYLEAKDEMQEGYMKADKNEKTKISQELVDKVHAWGGRFLKLEKDTENKWYEVLNITARKKASQTLREINTAEERAMKRAKYAK